MELIFPTWISPFNPKRAGLFCGRPSWMPNPCRRMEEPFIKPCPSFGGPNLLPMDGFTCTITLGHNSEDAPSRTCIDVKCIRLWKFLHTPLLLGDGNSQVAIAYYYIQKFFICDPPTIFTIGGSSKACPFRDGVLGGRNVVLVV